MSRLFKKGDRVVVIGGPMRAILNGASVLVTSELLFGPVTDVETNVVENCGYYQIDYQVPWKGRMQDIAVLPRYIMRAPQEALA